MKLSLLLFWMASACVASTQEYTLTAPTKLRPGTQYRFAVTIYGVKKVSYTLHAKFQNADFILTEKKFNVKNQASTQSSFTLYIPKLVPGYGYDFIVSVSGDVSFNGSYNIKVLRKTHSLFIQTDKSLYKPGQTVLFRVVAVQSDLKPFVSPVNTTIFDPSGNKIYQLLNQKDVTGVVKGRLKLSDLTPLGQWRIQVQAENSDEERFFQVAEYVLPKFEVKVVSPSYYFINVNNPKAQKDLHITTTALYTFGKPVKGTALVSIQIKYPWYMAKAPTGIILKTVMLEDGKADLTITFEELNKIAELSQQYSEDLFIQSNVTEEVTGVILQVNANVPIELQRYKLEFLSISADTYKPGFPYHAYVKLSQFDGSEPQLSDITEANGKLKSLQVEVAPGYDNEMKSVKSFEFPLTASGYVQFEVPIPKSKEGLNSVGEGSFELSASFLDSEANETMLTKKWLNAFEVRDNNYVQLTLLSKEQVIKPGVTLKMSVKTSEKISVFQYHVLGKAGLLISKTVNVGKPSTSSTFELVINPNLASQLAPEARIVVFFITSTGELVADSLSLSVIDFFSNKVSISFNTDSTSPGKDVVLRVNASKDSSVFLLAVDQSILLLSTANDITQKLVFDDINKYNYEFGGEPINNNIMFGRFWCPVWLGGSSTSDILENAGLFVLTNFFIILRPRFYPMYDFAVPMMAMRSENEVAVDTLPESQTTPNKPRKNFPETWIWIDVKVGANGSLDLVYTVPDTITSWIATAFATNPRVGLGVSENSAKMTVIKPFFISLNLPYSIVRGEQFALQVTVFNYYGQDLQVDVTLPKSSYFKVAECVGEKEGESQNKEVTKKVFVKNNDMVTVYYWIVATSLGQIPIEVKSFAGVAADSLIVNLLVKPEGQPQFYSSSSLIRMPPDQTSEVSFEVSLPTKDKLVPDSTTIEATVIGDILGSTINNLDNLLQMPYGCGEQNMLTLAPDVYVLDYLTTSGQLTSEINSKALEYINAGYQRELTYQRTDGSFSAFGNNDPAGSVWLSSFVSKVFRQAKGYIPIEDQKISQTLNWIISQQNSNGSFSEPPLGKVIHTDMQGGSSSGIALTAYALISLVQNKDTLSIDQSDLQSKISLAVTYLENEYKNYATDPYVLSIINYAFYLAKSPKLTDVLALLEKLAVKEGDSKYWHKKIPGTQDTTDIWIPPYSRPQSNDIEMTSYVLLTYASQADLGKSIPIAKWLVKQRNAQGGFSSTQDTVLGLEALSRFAKLVVPPKTSEGLKVEVKQDATEEVHKFVTINRETALLLQSKQLPSNVTKVKFSATGKGLALVQINVAYYVKSQYANKYLEQTITAKNDGKKLNLHICLRWLGEDESGMVLTEVNLLTGYGLAEDYEDQLSKGLENNSKKHETGNNKLVIYLDQLTKASLCFDVLMEPRQYVSHIKPALVKTYRYYETTVSVSGYYSPTSTSTGINPCDPIFN